MRENSKARKGKKDPFAFVNAPASPRATVMGCFASRLSAMISLLMDDLFFLRGALSVLTPFDAIVREQQRGGTREGKQVR